MTERSIRMKSFEVRAILEGRKAESEGEETDGTEETHALTYMFISRKNTSHCVIGGKSFVSKMSRDRLKREFVERRAELLAKLIFVYDDCYYCGADLIVGHYGIDHRVPLKRGGTNDIGNLVLACSACNQAKAWMTDDEFFQIVMPVREKKD